jgi:outer membrane protein TolC
MLPWKGTLAARQDVALSIAKSQFEKIAATRLELRYKLKQAYFQLYDLEKKQLILHQSINLFETLESVTTTRVETGKAALADVLRIQLRIHELEQEIRILENQKEKPVSVINQVLNRPGDGAVVVIDTLSLVTISYDTDELMQNILMHHPMMRMYALQQETAERAIRLNTLEGRPSFAVGIDYINVGKRSDATPENNGRDILSPRVGVRLPIYRDKYRGKEQEERLRIQALRTRSDDLFIQFRSAIERALADLEEGQIKYQLYEDQKTTTQDVIDLLLAEYSSEGKGFVDLLQAENQLIQYDLMLLGAIVKTHLAKTEIERYIP